MTIIQPDFEHINRGYKSFDYMGHALQEILGTHLDRCYVKAKSLNKFGTTTVGTSFKTIQSFQGSEINETFVTTNLIDAVISSDNGDDMTLTVEGQTINALGQLTFKVQDVTLTGHTKAALSTPLARATRAYVKASGTFGTDPADLVPAGTVSFYDDTDGDNGSGVPSTAAAVKMILDAGLTQTRKCATAISNSDYWILTAFEAAITDAANSTDFVTMILERRDIENGGTWRPLGREIILKPDNLDRVYIPFKPYLIVPKNHDIRVVGATDASTAPVFAQIDGVLANIFP